MRGWRRVAVSALGADAEFGSDAITAGETPPCQKPMQAGFMLIEHDEKH
jgi:hypothetical protein